jgi:HlyD family secretion protein
MKLRSFPYLLLIVNILACLSFGCSRSDPQEIQPGSQGRRGGSGGRGGVSIQTASIQKISIQRQVDLSGTLVSPDQAKVSGEVAGVIMDVMFELGHEVQARQVLVQLDTTELKLALDRAESALRQTEAQLGILEPSGPVPPDEQIATIRTAVATRDDSRAQMARAQELATKGLLPAADLDTAQMKLKVAEAQYQSALENIRALKASLQDRKAAYELAVKKVDDATIRSPISGSISERLVQRGEYIRENTQVATIVQVNPLKLRTAVQEKYSNIMRQNLAVQFRVESLPNDVFDGRIAYISPAVDQATRTLAVEVLVNNPQRKLKPGFFAKGAILTDLDEGVMAIPEDTVMTLAGVSSVFVVEKGTVKQQNVTLGVRAGKSIEVISGLKGDEILAASNLNQLVSGMQVSTGSGEETKGGHL